MTIAVAVLSVLLLSVVVVLLIDIVPAAMRWYERIGTGAFADAGGWYEAVRRTAEKQLKKTPAVTISGNTRLTVIDRLKGSYKNKKLQSWQQAALLLGMNSCGTDAETAVKDFIISKIEGGRWRDKITSVDFALLGYAVLSSPAADSEKLRPAMDGIYSFLIAAEKDGTVPYNNNLQNIRFVDTVGMICPFLYAYAAVYSCPEAAALAKRQAEEYIKNGMHEGIFLPVHCFDKESGAPLGIYGWGRGCGWLALGLAESIKYAPDGDREYLLEASKKYAGALLRFQSGDGSWCRQTAARDTAETSATAMIGYFMSCLYEICGNDEYKKSSLAARAALMSRTRKNGKIDYAQGDTLGIGFYSPWLDTLPAAQGFSLLLASSVGKTGDI